MGKAIWGGRFWSGPKLHRLMRASRKCYLLLLRRTSYKYGCNGWDSDEETKQKAETMLRRRYPHGPWTAKLAENEESEDKPQ
jgi:hypothetical protein